MHGMTTEPMVTDTATSYEKKMAAAKKEKQSQIDSLVKSDPNNPLIKELQKDLREVNKEDQYGNPENVAFGLICNSIYDAKDLFEEGEMTFEEATNNLIKIIQTIQKTHGSSKDDAKKSS